MAAPTLSYYDYDRFDGQYSTHTMLLRNAELELFYGMDGTEVQLKGQLSTGTSGTRYYLNGPPTKENTDVYLHPGSVTVADTNGNALTITPTGQNGYTVTTGGEDVRVNARMNDTIREHITRCLNYAKPKPVAELES